ncbi:transcriptional regulator [Microbispora sp. H10830]|uniref:MmyB family transcriptional regulator n=1 Tax=Microbispora sp. H10830 TaxID=2729109 RepID=UPI0015FF4D71|nr:transcriptional regulator [Microbispora sp. H10830]
MTTASRPDRSTPATTSSAVRSRPPVTGPATRRSHLHTLTHHAAGRRLGSPATSPVTPPTAAALLDRLRPWPALVLARNGDVLAANPEGLALYAGLGSWPARRRNTLRYVFTHSAARSVLGDWSEAAATSVANLRYRTAADPDAPDLCSIRDELAAASADFRLLWDRHDVRPRRSGAKTFRHPAVGDLVLAHQSWHLDDSSVRLSLYQPEPGYEDRLHLLTLGTGVAGSPG